jgi:hypothetical protein
MVYGISAGLQHQYSNPSSSRHRQRDAVCASGSRIRSWLLVPVHAAQQEQEHWGILWGVLREVAGGGSMGLAASSRKGVV